MAESSTWSFRTTGKFLVFCFVYSPYITLNRLCWNTSQHEEAQYSCSACGTRQTCWILSFSTTIDGPADNFTFSFTKLLFSCAHTIRVEIESKHTSGVARCNLHFIAHKSYVHMSSSWTEMWQSCVAQTRFVNIADLFSQPDKSKLRL